MKTIFKNKIVLAAAILAVVAAGYAVFFPKSNVLAPTGLEYKNMEYGFTVSLPESWKGYSIVSLGWKGYAVGAGGNTPAEQGPQIMIRHPQWTAAVPRQDIPIMVFTIAQWNSLQQEKFYISAAPFGPSKLDENSKYIFALPPRYNYAFPEGYQEVDEIMLGKPLHAF